MVDAPTYATIKDSGIDWIGYIPESWNVRTLYQMVTQVKNKNSELQENNLLSLSYGKIKRKDIDSPEGLLPASFDGYNIIEDGDIVLRLTDLQNDHTSLRVGLSTERGIITSAYTTLRPISTRHSKYIYYLLHAFDLKKGFYGMGSGVRQGLNYDEVKVLRVVLPSETEQEAITTYLDDQCQQIDFIINEAKTSIEEYKAWKASIIYETVTKGLNPTVEMQDSGVQWIGEMPIKWGKIRIKYCADFAPSCDISQFCDESIVTFAPMECIKNGYYINREGVFGSLNSSYTPFQEGDIVVAKVTPCFENGNIAIMNGLHNKFGFGSSELFVFRAKTVLTKYLFYCLQNEMLKQHACATMTGTGGLKRVSPAFLKNSYICLPSEDEQQAIADHLDRKCSAIEILMAEKQALINDLESYKRSLIYETVSGKRKVV